MSNKYVRFAIPGGTQDAALPKTEAGVQEVFKKNDGSEYIISMVGPGTINPNLSAEEVDAQEAAMDQAITDTPGAAAITEADYNTDKNSGNYTELTE